MFPANDAPKYRQTHGYIAALIFVIALTIWTSLVLGWFDRYHKPNPPTTHSEDGTESISIEGNKDLETPASKTAADVIISS